MDIFAYKTTGPDATILENGKLVNNLKSIQWVERYREAGEFTLVAPATSDIRNDLPVGTFISHINAYEVMVVENHEIVEASDDSKDQDIVITGRSMETIFEQRVVGGEMSRTFPPVDPLEEYYVTAANSWSQAMILLGEHSDPFYGCASADKFTNVDATFDVQTLTIPWEYNVLADPWAAESTTPIGSTDGYRAYKRGNVYEALLELLSVDDLGVRVVRPGPWMFHRPGAFPGPWTTVSGGPHTGILVHNGKNRSHRVIFSYSTGEIESADYLWSNKNYKTHALVQGKWAQQMADLGSSATGYDRRIMYVDGSFIDEGFDVAPTGTDLTDIADAMAIYGRTILASQKNVELIRADISKTNGLQRYRIDYDIGDIVRVEGNYNTTALARVTEYVEIQNEEGESGYPTLSLIYDTL